MDFTIKKYIKLLKVIKEQGYSFITLKEYFENKNLPNKFVILRHDVDLLPENSFKFAKIQYQEGIQGTYYFRSI